MKKFLKWSAIVIGVLFLLAFAGFQYMKSQTKKASPEVMVEYKKDGKDIEVFYCSPSKKGREIFGALVPHGKVWRTGANEASTFETQTDITIQGQKLAAGKYTIWTIPNKDEWTLIFNSKEYGWGVNFDSEAAREAEYDVLQVKAHVKKSEKPLEKFTISFEEGDSLNLVFAWDQTVVAFPVK